MNLLIGRYMSKATGLWNAAKEAYRAAKGLLSKNERNAATAQAKKERGPVKAMFHITKNENVPAIEQQGLVANNPNANVNSAYQPFSSVGVKGGGNWVVDQPTAFPVYGTTVGGKYGNEAARRDALTTFKIEFPVSKLPTTRAVRDPYGDAKLTTADKGWSPFGTWTGNDVNTMAILEDIDPKYLKNIGYVEELNPAIQAPVPKEHLIEKHIPGREYLSQNDLDELRSLEQAGLNKADRTAMSYMTGHDVSAGKNPNVTVPADRSKSPARFVEDYLNRNRPIKDRMAKLPQASYRDPWEVQFLEFKPITEEGLAPATAVHWTEEFKPYTKIGEDATKRYIFQPGAISRGMGHLPRPDKRSLRARRFDWDAYNRAIARGKSPEEAMADAMPDYILDWDNIVYSDDFGYAPKFKRVSNRPKEGGRISAGKQAEAPVEIEGEPITFRRLLELDKDPDFDYWSWHPDFVNKLNELRDLSGGKWDYLDGNATWNDILKATLKAQTHPWYHLY